MGRRWIVPSGFAVLALHLLAAAAYGSGRDGIPCTPQVRTKRIFER